MCILKEAEPKNRGSVIRPSEEPWVGNGSRQAGREGPWLRTRIRGRVGVLAPGPVQTHAVILSKLKLPVSVLPSGPTLHPLCEWQSQKIAGEEPQGMTAQGGGGDGWLEETPGSPPATGPCEL